jgi:hypothetical protein
VLTVPELLEYRSRVANAARMYDTVGSLWGHDSETRQILDGVPTESALVNQIMHLMETAGADPRFK